MPVFYPSYFSTAESLLNSYACGLPFAAHLKSFFSKNKKFGSRDRKIISELCYSSLRIGKSMDSYSLHDGMLIGYFLCNQTDMGCVETEIPEFSPLLAASYSEKIAYIQSKFPLFKEQDIFPWSQFLSSTIEKDSFLVSHLHKPSFFIRTRNTTHQQVLDSLKKADIEFEIVSSTTIRIGSQINLGEYLQLDKDCFIQDISSQQTLNLVLELKLSVRSIWDACSGSGGKLLLAATFWPKAEFYASDIRPSILEEMQRRTQQFGVSRVHDFCIDLSQELAVEAVKSYLPASGVDLILADVPCSGSGTWSRSPEWLTCFEYEQLLDYQTRQKKIVSNLSRIAKKGTYILYITCSVFKMENEDVVQYMQDQCGLTLLKHRYFLGYNEKGDSLFAALFNV